MLGMAWSDIGGIVSLAVLICGMFAAVAKWALVKPLEARIDKNGSDHHAQLKTDNSEAIGACRDELRREIRGARDELKTEIQGSREEAHKLVRHHVQDLHGRSS